jgi:Na+/phosphate symporter
MKDLIEDIEKDIHRYLISIKKLNITNENKKYIQGMIDSASRILYNIELNYYKTYEEIHEENAKKYREKFLTTKN